jgi:2-C-methyl-D-erythritol 4-phosphate cytidylyltransferase
MPACLIIPAGGTGTRFGGPLPKQFLDLAGVPVLRRSLDAFAGLVGGAVIAAHPDHHPRVRACCAGLPYPVAVVPGGATRLESVLAALVACDGDPVLVHDAVRPLVPNRCIRACLDALTRHQAAVVAQPCAATVKAATQDGCVARTVPRDGLWLAQTPQGFHHAVGLAAFARARAEGWNCTDDAEVLERAGHQVALVPGDPRNLKITEPGDLALAEAILRTCVEL